MERFLSSMIYATLTMAGHSEATCNLDQQYSCRRAVREERLDVLPGGGECFEKEYVQFAYLCVVNNYLPSVDYCCCSFDRTIFCCRYHQDWNQFRCLHQEDEVTPRSLNETDSHLGRTDPLARIMQLSLPSVLLLLILLLLGLGIIGCCIVATGVSCCSRRFRNRIFRIKDKNRDCVPKKTLTKFKESRFLQRTPVRDLDSLSGLMQHGLTGLSSPDHHHHHLHLSPAPITYQDDPIPDEDAFPRPDGHRFVLQPTAPSLAEILSQEGGQGCSHCQGHPFSLSTDSACWWNSFLRPTTLDRETQDCVASSSVDGSIGDRREDRYSGSPNRYQLYTDPRTNIPSPPPPHGVEGCRQSQVVTANSRH